MSTTYDSAPIAAQPRNTQAMIEVSAQREIAEIQGRMIMARRFPRDVAAAIDRIKMACARPELAGVALYTYARGGSNITGPSIRMAEAIAQSWGNIDFGIRELEQRAGESTMEAFAVDYETNTRSVKVFQVPHVRYTRNGGRSSLEDPRDVYEQTANQGSRRLRACILSIIPGDVIQTAVEQVEQTLKAKVNITPEKIASMLSAFAEYGVTKGQVEKRLQRRVESITPALMIDFGKILNSLRDGMSAAGDWFEPEQPDGNGGAPAPTSRTEAVKQQMRTAAPAPAATSEAERTEAGEVEDLAVSPGGETEPASDSEVATEDMFEPLTPADMTAKVYELATAKKMFNDDGKVVIQKRAAEKWGLPVGAWQVSQLISQGYGEKMIAMLSA